MEEKDKVELEKRVKQLEHENTEFRKWFSKLLDAMENINTTIQIHQKSLDFISKSVLELSKAIEVNRESIIESNKATKANSEAIIKLSGKDSWLF